ncbi:MAG: acyltransferase family protein [Lachnospiraceae bacterium]|nr:acyltransferase family protein [Lachnospiraceae bacterium]
MHDYVYLFHMPLFFFISGYLFKESYLVQPLTFISRRLRTCYMPFVKYYSILFLLFHELLYPLGFSESYDINKYLRQIFMIV